MANATTPTGPVPGNPYAVIVLMGSFDIERFNFPAPVDALVCAVRYLREGRQVRLTDRTCAALREAPDLNWVIDALEAHAANGHAPGTETVSLPKFAAPGAVPAALD